MLIAKYLCKVTNNKDIILLWVILKCNLTTLFQKYKKEEWV